jgi:hypothetical protein
MALTPEQLKAAQAELRAKLEERAAYFARERLRYDWSKQGRPNQQLPDGEWSVVMYLAGRGWG